jgi:two-component system CheB/CheR fusion protein
VPAQETEAAIHQGDVLNERWYMRKDGSRFWGSGVTTAMHDTTGRPIGFLKIKRDQTERLRIQESLERNKQELLTALEEKERARAEAEAAGRAKDQFLAARSHELRTIDSRFDGGPYARPARRSFGGTPTNVRHDSPQHRSRS